MVEAHSLCQPQEPKEGLSCSKPAESATHDCPMDRRNKQATRLPWGNTAPKKRRGPPKARNKPTPPARARLHQNVVPVNALDEGHEAKPKAEPL